MPEKVELETINDVEALIAQKKEWYDTKAQEMYEQDNLVAEMRCEAKYESYKDVLKMMGAVNNE